MFYDQARIFVRSGNGGDGMISFRREIYVPYGGPDGGDGGWGGDIVFVVDPKLNSLVKYHRLVHYQAGHGGHGSKRKRHGANGKALRLPVPAGTVIRLEKTGAVLADLTEPDQEFVVLHGGKGGKGNIHYVNSVNQAPRLAERGEPGQEAWLTLELKLIADVGIVGVPNAGKSTLLSAVSAARPKIGNYPFTTLQPNLGVAQLDGYETLVLADIPGLIEGASAGVGLGHDFLRHVERTRVLIHLLDGAAEDPLEDWAMINQELTLYDVALEDKPQLVVLNKMDLPDAAAWESLVKERVKEEGYTFCAISAVSGQGIRDMLRKAKQMVAEAPPPPSFAPELVVIQPEEDENVFTIEREPDGWRVHGKRIERVAAMTYFEFEATANRFQQILHKMGISQALEAAGVQPGDTVCIGDEELEWGGETE